jgi:hypothetical protein
MPFPPHAVHAILRRMARIVTLTQNPAIDVARALRELGGETRAVDAAAVQTAGTTHPTRAAFEALL